MIVVSLKKSMPSLLIDKRRGAPDKVLLDQMEHITRGDWAGISSQAIVEYGDFIAGAYEDRIVSVYRITGHNPVNAVPVAGRITFEVAPAPELLHMIGQPIPGGRWKRGEARPVRYISTTEVEHFLNHEVGVVNDIENFQESEQACSNHAAATLKVLDDLTAEPTTVANPTLLDLVEVAKDPRGGVVVTVPNGTKVTIVQRPA